MSYATRDLDQQRPDRDAILAAWREVEITAVKPGPALAALEAALLESHSSGWAAVRQFDLGENAVLEYFVCRNGFKQANFFRKFFERSEVRSQFKILTSFNGNYHTALGTLNDKVDDFANRPTFCALGDIASSIGMGGAYGRFSGGDEAIFHLITEFAREALGMRVTETSTWRNWAPWAEGFYDVAWDGSFLFFDKPRGRVTVLAYTDTD